VGRNIQWNNHQFRIIGVLQDWSPQPKFYDLNNGPFDVAEGAYIPFGWGPALELLSAGSSNCWKPEPLDSYKDLMTRTVSGWKCGWSCRMPTAATHAGFLDAYWTEQHASGRFPRPRRNQLTPVPQWLVDQGVVENDNRLLVGLSFAFLAVSLINTVGLLLAKFSMGQLSRVCGAHWVPAASRFSSNTC